MTSQKRQGQQRSMIGSDTPVPTQKQPGGDVSKTNSDRGPGENEDVPGEERQQQQQEPTTSKSKGKIKQDGHQGEKSVVHGHRHPNSEEVTTSQSVQAKKQKKSRRKEEVHELDSESVVHGHMNPNSEDITTSQSVQAKKQQKGRHQKKVHRSDLDSVFHGHMNPNSEEVTTRQSVQAKKQGKGRPQRDVHKLDSESVVYEKKEKEKKKDGQRAGDDHGSDSDAVVHGQFNTNLEEDTTSQNVQPKKQKKDKHQGDFNRSDSKSFPPGHTNENAELMQSQEEKRCDLRQEQNRDGEQAEDDQSSDLESVVDHRSDSKLDPSNHIYEEVQDSHRPKFKAAWPRPQVTKLKDKKKTGLEGDKGRPNVTLVLLGQSGSGKSASGNTILGKEVFESCISSVPVTTQCRKVETQIFGIHVTVIDTPDFFGDDLKNRGKALEDCKSIIKATKDHKFLLVMQLGRFTDGERDILPQIKAMFGKEVVQNVIILFTHAKELNGKTLEEYVHKTDTNLQDVIKECGSRYYAFENTVKNPKEVSGLFDIICAMEGMTRKKAENKGCSIL